MKAENLQSLERAERMMMRWMCGVSVKDMRSCTMYSLLWVSVAEVVRCGRLRWFGHLEGKSGDDWVSACRNVEVVGKKSRDGGRKTWRGCVKDDMEELGLEPEWAVFCDMWRGFISGQTSNLSLKINDDDNDDGIHFSSGNGRKMFLVMAGWTIIYTRGRGTPVGAPLPARQVLASSPTRYDLHQIDHRCRSESPPRWCRRISNSQNVTVSAISS